MPKRAPKQRKEPNQRSWKARQRRSNKKQAAQDAFESIQDEEPLFQGINSFESLQRFKHDFRHRLYYESHQEEWERPFTNCVEEAELKYNPDRNPQEAKRDDTNEN